MTLSLGEIEALSRKATRGAGFSWGMADEASKSVRWLCSWGLPGAEALARYLLDRDGNEGPVDLYATTWTAAPARLCPLICGSAISDQGNDLDHLQLHTLDWPLLILPQVIWPDRACSISWTDTVISWDGALRISGAALTPRADLVTLSPRAQTQGKMCRQVSRANPMPQAGDVLADFAARTYAPETDLSKLTGAGAGLHDGD